MANKWQAAFNDELKKVAKKDTTTAADQYSWYNPMAYSDWFSGNEGIVPDAWTGGTGTTSAITNATGAGPGEGYFPGDQSAYNPLVPNAVPGDDDAPAVETPAVETPTELSSDAPGETPPVEVPVTEGPETPAADDVIGDIEANDNVTNPVVPGEDTLPTETPIETPISETPAADDLISDIETGDTEVTEDNMPTPIETPTETPVGDPNSSVTESQIPTEDLTPTENVTPTDVTPIANETVTPDNVEGTTPAADALPASHNDWGRATQDFTASEGAGYGSLSEAIKHRGTLDKGSDEYMAVQSDINRAYGKTNRSSDYYKNMQSASTPTPSVATDTLNSTGSDVPSTTGLENEVPLADGATDGTGATGDDGWYLGKNLGAERDWWKKKSSFISDIKSNRK